MSIDLLKKFDKIEKNLTSFLDGQKGSYYRSSCYKKLRDRYHRLKSSNDMAFNNAEESRGNNGVNSFISKVAFPIVKERTMIREAVLRQNFRGEPLITIEPASATPMENARNAQEILNANFKSTSFRSKVFRRLVQDVSEFGAGVAYTAWRESQKMTYKTVDTPYGIDRQEVPTIKKNAANYCVHILDYFQSPTVSDPDDSEFVGHIERINLSKLKAMVAQNEDVYIKRNMNWVIKEAEKASVEDRDYHSKYEDKDSASSNFPLDRIVMYSTCNIKGNEDNENYYYIEMIAGKIVRFQLNPHDDDMRPYAIFTFYPRREYWWGNSDAEFVLPHERYTNLIMSMKADNALRALQQYIFYEKDSIDVADWNNRHKNGGMIGVDTKGNKTLNQLLYQVQPQDYSLNSTDSIMREIKESQQKLTPRPDFTRAATAGGLKNTTATTAVILEEQGDVSEALILENFMFGLKVLAKNNIIMLQQRLGDTFAVRPSAIEDQKVLEKKQILGNFDYHIETSLNKNKASELLRLQNILTALMNFKGSGDPAFQQIDIQPLIKKILKNADIGDVEEYVPTSPLQQIPGAQPSLMLPGQEQAGAALELAPATTNPPEGALNAA